MVSPLDQLNNSQLPDESPDDVVAGVEEPEIEPVSEQLKQSLRQKNQTAHVEPPKPPDASHQSGDGWRGRVSNGVNRLLRRDAGDDQSASDKAKDAVKDKAKDELRNEAAKVAEKAAVKAGINVAADAVAPEIAVPLQVAMIAWKHRKVVLILFLVSVLLSISAIAAALGIGQTGILGSSFHVQSAEDTQLTSLANAGDIFARRELDAKDIPAILAAMNDVEKQANAKTPKEQAALNIASAIRTKLATFSSSDSKGEQQTMKDVGDSLQQLSAMGYGGVAAGDIGKKIASLARYYAADPAGIQKFQTCAVGDKTSCSGFVLRLIHDLNLDPSYGGTAYDQYLYTQKRSDCYDAFKAVKEKLAVGDILYSDYKNDNGYGHTAIYLGNGEVAAASLNDHPPQVYKWNPGRLNSAVRFKNGPCQAKS